MQIDNDKFIEWLHRAELILLKLGEAPFLRLSTTTGMFTCPACNDSFDPMDSNAHAPTCVAFAANDFRERLRMNEPRLWELLLQKRLMIADRRAKQNRVEMLKKELAELQQQLERV